MKRLLKVSLDLFLLSFISIFSWFCLSLLIDKNLINIFTLIYPIQFIWYMLKSIFSIGANINKEKDKNNDAVMSGIILGIIFAFLISLFLLLNIDSYINLMNMSVSLYKNFAIYSIIHGFIQLIFLFIIEKLYYEEKNILANKYSIIFNLINFTTLIGMAIFIKNQILIIILTLTSISFFTIYVCVKHFEKFHFNVKLGKWIKYDSVELFNNFIFFLIFLFGLSNVIEYGSAYTLALTFVALITDCQWDTFTAIAEVANIDISKRRFEYKEHIKNAYRLLFWLVISVFIMFVTLYNFYDLNLRLVLIYLSFEILNFILYPLYTIKTCYLKLEYSSMKITFNKVFANLLRFSFSMLSTPFCTGLGQIFSSLYQFISTSIIFRVKNRHNKC